MIQKCKKVKDAIIGGKKMHKLCIDKKQGE